MWCLENPSTIEKFNLKRRTQRFFQFAKWSNLILCDRGKAFFCQLLKLFYEKWQFQLPARYGGKNIIRVTLAVCMCANSLAQAHMKLTVTLYFNRNILSPFPFLFLSLILSSHSLILYVAYVYTLYSLCMKFLSFTSHSWCCAK